MPRAPGSTGFASGVGPLAHRSSRSAARVAFATMDHVSARDEGARAAARMLSGKPVHLLPDQGICLDAARAEEALALLRIHGVVPNGRQFLGVAIRRWSPPRPRLVPRRLAHRLGFSDPQEGPEGRVMIERLAALLDWQVERHGERILFLPTYCVPSEAHDLLARRIVRRMRRGGDADIVRVGDARVLKACTGLCRAFLGGRMHPMILAAGMGVPLVGLGYNPKFDGFAELIGMADGVVDVRVLVHGDGADRLDHLLERALRGEAANMAAVERCRDLVEQGTARLFAAV